ncbi:MAG: ABC transporter ATP-binding protein [Elusimicrobia bacterium]|nr:ABC transporter ATP-binding protein [Elusimicrobiota bacterium]
MVEIDAVVKVYGDAGGYRALDGVSFTVPEGQFAAIMGPSGCGKSTLLNVLGLMDQPTSGSYKLDATAVQGLSDAERTHLRRDKLGFVFQSFNLLPRMTALQNVCLPMGYAGLSRKDRLERAHGLLARVGLKGKELRTPLELSGGERQRVGIARSLANRPRLLLADEPTGNLDSKTSVEIMALFRELHAEGMTLLLVTHDPGIAAQADRILRVKDGRIVADERPAAQPA